MKVVQSCKFVPNVCTFTLMAVKLHMACSDSKTDVSFSLCKPSDIHSGCSKDSHLLFGV